MRLNQLISGLALSLSATFMHSVPAQPIPASGQAASSYPGYEPWKAFDGNYYTGWTSGTFPPASIDAIFSGSLSGHYVISSIQASSIMWPNPGFQQTYLFGRTSDGGYVYLGIWQEVGFDGKWYYSSVFNPTPFNALTLYTNMGETSWVGWRDIYVTGVPYVAPPPPPPPPPGPIASGDVVGRDLANTPIFGPLGHVGVFDGVTIMQIMDETVTVQAVSWDSFRSKAAPWPTVYTNIPRHTVLSCYEPECVYWDPPFGQQLSEPFANIAIGRRARQVQLAGSDYTLTTAVAVAWPKMYDQRAGIRYPQRRGMYRCDTFVMDAFAYSHTPIGSGQVWTDMLGGGYPVSRWAKGEQQAWANNISGMLTSAGVTPVQLYNRIRSW